MISLKEAIQKANEYHNNLRVIRCAELDDSWIFTLGKSNSEAIYGLKPLRVQKNDGKIYEWDTIKNNSEFKKRFLKEIKI